MGLGVLLLAGACITKPKFETLDTDPSGSAVGHADEMALIPATTLAGSTLKPTGTGKGPGPGKDKNKGKCQGEGCDDDDDENGGSSGGGGAPPPVDDGMAPSEPVIVPAFRIDVREASVREYAACVTAGACGMAGDGAGCTVPAGLGEHPVTCVNRAQAAAYCAWRQKRLVRYDEWSAAAAGSALRPFPWGAELPSPERVNACGPECKAPGMYATPDGFVMTAPSGSFPAGRSPEGVFDLAGNVAEWVDDESVVRGGSYADGEPASVGAFTVRSVAPETSEPSIGFRCARDP